MREIITLHAGQSGCQMGHQFWQDIGHEHGLNEQGIFNSASDLQMKHLNIFFNESSTGRFVPRTVLFDTECGALNDIRSSKWGDLYNPESYVFGNNGSINNFGKGYNGYDAGIVVESVKRNIRKLIEAVDTLDSFMITHALGGGTGSGTVSKILECLSDEYASQSITTTTLFPPPECSAVVVEPYNAILTMERLIEYTTQNICIDNDALFNMCKGVLELENPKHEDLNRVVCFVLAGLTSSLRFRGKHNMDFNKAAHNLIPFPHLHFYIASFAPLLSKVNEAYTSYTLQDLTTQVFEKSNVFCSVDVKSGIYFCSTLVYRGDVNSQDVAKNVASLLSINNNDFISWIPTNIKTAIVREPHPSFVRSCTALKNSTAIKSLFQRLYDNYNLLFSQSAYLHWYKKHDVETDDFKKSAEAVNGLLSEYNEYKRTPLVDE